ncbi:growth factor receptor-bound protein 14-like protein [Dinothrombium tinctorium]|uniref:Growth factor receptor-bound protein 14-like protein n=1 Tax=Dinothrombium tinctorium TaxID=1965070 RepID=A0A3S3PEE2_9ACAR|nr:growth factor receptor-bound protein 14-like protein [Dinothrombium tinctorium]
MPITPIQQPHQQLPQHPATSSTSSFSDDFLSYHPVNEGTIEVFFEDKRCEMLIDENLRSSDLCHLLMVKMSLNQVHNYTIILQLLDLNLERILQDEEEVLPQYNSYLGKYKCKLILKMNHFHYDFIHNPMSYFPLDMISFGPEDYETTNRIKIANLQDQLISSETLNLTISGPLQYHKETANDCLESRRVVAQINCVDEELICSDIDSGRKISFNVHQNDLFYPINDAECKPALRTANSYVFALINYDDKGKKFDMSLCFSDILTGTHWFSANSEIQRQCWLVAIRVVKYGLINLRNSYLKLKRDTVESVSPSTTYLNMNQRYDSCSMHEYNNGDTTDQVAIEQVRDSRSRSTHDGNALHGSRTSLVLYSDPDRSIKHLCEPWFYGEMSRKEAAEILHKYKTIDGVFLVRPSQRNPGSFVLSFIWKEKVNHVPIMVADESGQVSVSLDCGRTKFYDLKQLVEFYQLNIGCLPTKLTHFLVHR